MSDTFDFSTMADFFEQLGFGGATSGADIVRLLGEQADTAISPEEQRLFARDIDPLLAVTRGGLADLPGRFSELTGQAQETARIGRRGIRESFLGERGGLERTALGQTRQFQSALARTGFAGSGALRRGREIGREQLGEQFEQLLGRRRTGLGGVEAGLERGLFGARTTVSGQQASLLAALMGGIQNLRATLRGEGVFGAEGDGGGSQLPVPPTDYHTGYRGDPLGPDLESGAWNYPRWLRETGREGGPEDYTDWEQYVKNYQGGINA